MAMAHGRFERLRKKAGLQIDPETAEVELRYAQVLDPYGVNPDLPEDRRQVGRDYFARSPGSDVWVWFDDLPAVTQEALRNRQRSRLAFPAGILNGGSKLGNRICKLVVPATNETMKRPKRMPNFMPG